MSLEKSVDKTEFQKPGRTIIYVVIAVIVFTAIACQFITPKPQPKADDVTATGVPVVETPETQNLGGASPCGAFDAIAAAEQYNEAPSMEIDPAKQYFATFKMAKGGEFVVQLYPDKAPITVNSFVFLSCKGFFNGATFHRVLAGFMAQGGDPTGTGMGGPGYEFVNENSDLVFDKAGIMAMANAGPDTNGSQFFITFAPAEFLDGGYTIFGQVIEGMDVVNSITRRDPEQNPAFEGDAMESVTISEK